MKKPKVLLTTFEPFGGESVNPAQLCGELVHSDIAQIVRVNLPVSYAKVGVAVAQAVENVKPDMVLCLGQAAGRQGLSFERVAINIDDAQICDNCGELRCDLAIEPLGKTAYFSTLPIKAMINAAQEVGAPAWLSNSAGTYVCNHLLYELLHNFGDIPCGFVHVPLVKEQAEQRLSCVKVTQLEPYLSPEAAAKGISAAIDTAIVTLGL